jgi:Leucine-rich repeat (LRR) protein
MATETFISKKYTVELLPGETEDLLMIRVNEGTYTYESHILVIVDSLNIFPVIKNCFLGTHGYKLFYEMTNPQTLTLWFEARVGGFMYMEFSSHLAKVGCPNGLRDCHNMVSRLSYKKRGDSAATRIFGGAHIQIKDRDHYDIGTTRELVISGKDTKVLCANIEHLVFLQALTLDSLYIDLHTMNNYNLRELTINNCDLTLLEGLRGFPQLESLTLISCQILDGKQLIEMVLSHLPSVKKITINKTEYYDGSTTILC